MIKVRRYAEVSCSGNPLGHLFHEFVDSVLVLDKDDGVERSAVIGLADVKVHWAAIHFDLITVRFHKASSINVSLRVASSPLDCQSQYVALPSARAQRIEVVGDTREWFQRGWGGAIVTPQISADGTPQL